MKSDCDLIMYGDTNPAGGGRDEAERGALGGGRQILTRSKQRSPGWHLESPCTWLLSIHCFLFFEMCFRCERKQKIGGIRRHCLPLAICIVTIQMLGRTSCVHE